MTQNKLFALFGGAAMLFSGVVLTRAQEALEEPAGPAGVEDPAAATVDHPECAFFMRRDKFQAARLDAAAGQRSALTADVVKRLSAGAEKSAKSFDQPDKFGTIDKYLYADMQAHSVTPADKTTDY